MICAPRRQKCTPRGPEINFFQCCVSERILAIGSKWKVQMAPKITPFILKNTNTIILRQARVWGSHLISCERELFFFLHFFLRVSLDFALEKKEIGVPSHRNSSSHHHHSFIFFLYLWNSIYLWRLCWFHCSWFMFALFFVSPWTKPP